MNHTREAIFLCRNESFHRWIERNGFYMWDTISEKSAREFVLKYCMIESRAELENNLEARDRFLKLKAEFETNRVRRTA